MAEYYYFAASLPMLRMDREAPLSYDDFMHLASEHLSKRDYSDIQHAVLSGLEGDVSLPVVREWQEYALKLSRAINHARSERLGFSGYGKGSGEKELDEKARDIVMMDDPLEGERAVLSLYFDFLTSRESGSPFSSAALMIYALKLQILERSRAFDAEKGRRAFDRLYGSIEERIKG